MSVQSLYTAATGMEALETKLDVIANNLANVNTVGFEKDRANFEDLFYRDEIVPGALDASGTPTPIGTSVGLGTRVSGVQSDFVQGAFQDTQRELDLAIEGRGFLQVNDPATNQTLFTRAGNLSRNANGDLVLGSAQTGRPLEPPINIPQNAGSIVIDAFGQVSYREFNSPTLVQAGTIQMANFVDAEGLLKVGENLYSQTDASGTPIIGNPGVDGLGSLRQGALEMSNVEPVRELIDLITTQRSFELNSQAVQAGDQLLQLVANLRRL